MKGEERLATGAAALPEGMTPREAAFMVGLVARLKSRRFGRLVVTVSDGRIVDVEFQEKVDRRMLETLSGAAG